MPRPAEWAWSFSSLSFSWFSGAFEAMRHPLISPGARTGNWAALRPARRRASSPPPDVQRRLVRIFRSDPRRNRRLALDGRDPSPSSAAISRADRRSDHRGACLRLRRRRHPGPGLLSVWQHGIQQSGALRSQRRLRSSSCCSRARMSTSTPSPWALCRTMRRTSPATRRSTRRSPSSIPSCGRSLASPSAMPRTRPRI